MIVEHITFYLFKSTVGYTVSYGVEKYFGFPVHQIDIQKQYTPNVLKIVKKPFNPTTEDTKERFGHSTLSRKGNKDTAYFQFCPIISCLSLKIKNQLFPKFEL